MVVETIKEFEVSDYLLVPGVDCHGVSISRSLRTLSFVHTHRQLINCVEIDNNITATDPIIVCVVS